MSSQHLEGSAALPSSLPSRWRLHQTTKMVATDSDLQGESGAVSDGSGHGPGAARPAAPDLGRGAGASGAEPTGRAWTPWSVAAAGTSELWRRRRARLVVGVRSRGGRSRDHAWRRRRTEQSRC